MGNSGGIIWSKERDAGGKNEIRQKRRKKAYWTGFLKVTHNA